ncbi:MAG: hypothetical protein ACK49N_07375 [Verrucomicrobiota bacterium]
MTTLIEDKPTKLSEFKAIKDQDKTDLEEFIEQQFTDVWFDARNGVHLVKKGDQIVPDKGYLKGLEYPISKFMDDNIEKSLIRKLDARIKSQKSIQYHGPIAGRKTGDIVQCNGIDWLVTSSPKLIEPIDGTWPHLKRLIETLLPEGEAQLATYSWLKIQVQAIRSGNHSKCPMLILAGDANDGKSFFLRLITILRGGREINPMKAWNGEGAVWTDHLIGAECLNIDDSAAQKDYRSRENLSAKFKEAIYADSVTIDKRHTSTFTLSPRPVWGVSMAVNANGHAIKVVPALDGADMKDKAIVLRTQHAEILNRDGGDEFAAKRMQIYLDELPAFLYWILHFKLPETLPQGCGGSRSGAVIYRDPKAMKMLHRASPAGLLEEALLEYREKKLEEPNGKQWDGETNTAAGWMNRLRYSGMGLAADRRVPENANTMGIYLKQIADRLGSCIEEGLTNRNGSKLWRLKPLDPPTTS